MHVVAIYGARPGDSSQVEALAKGLACGAYDARARLTHDGPSVVAVHRERGPMEGTATRLRTLGFQVVIVDSEQVEQPERWHSVRTFELLPPGWRITMRGGRRVAIPWPDVTLIARGTGITETTSTEVVKGKKLAVGRAIATGGLVRNKKTKKEVSHSRSEREGFLHVYARGSVSVVRETAVDYGGLEDGLQLSRAANFLALLQTLRQRAPRAVFDDSLLTRVGQARVLGPQLDPQRYLRLASALVSATVDAAAR